ncbi:EAL domain-containing protein [Lichenicoccus sp.]|uniref:putative bifunctional diguanylate cyclase/phosphodiesterase n=1 Tax=Lichenicoccus sp. TaxID=2781899 RepID=UPI003D11C891
MMRVIGCITNQHDPRLLVLAACICLLACFTTLTLVARAERPGRLGLLAWLAAAAAVFGCGVWSLHFVAMLAFMPGTEITYRPGLTLLSILVATCGTLLALLCQRLSLPRGIRCVLAGTALGASVAAMHATGVAAMDVPGTLWIDRPQLAWSLVVGILLAMIAFARSDRLSRLGRRIEVSAWLAACVLSIHFIGMSALQITLGPHAAARGMPGPGVGAPGGFSYGMLATGVGAVSLVVLVASLAATLMEQHLSDRTVLELKRLRLLSSISREVMIIHQDGLILEVNAAGATLFGEPMDALIGRQFLELFSAGSQAAAQAQMNQGSEPQAPAKLEVRVRGGRLVPVEVACRAIDFIGRPATAVALVDQSERRRDAETIRHLAQHDALTGVPNRLLLHERMIHTLAASDAQQTSVALLHLDLDRFKACNDLLGDHGADLLLSELASRLTAELRSSDTLARIGGDEFVIVCALQDDARQVAALAGRLLETLGQAFEHEGLRVAPSASIGIALYPQDAVNQAALLRAAGTALREAKRESPGSFKFFERGMDLVLHERVELEHDLRLAIENDELELHYQPLFSCSSGVIEGYEALIRWHHPKRGMVMPIDFIPLAEQTGLIVPVGEWAIRTACIEASTWPARQSIAVNVSPMQFRQSNLPSIVADALLTSGLPAHRLEIEITEGVLITDTDEAIRTLSALRAQGVRVSLDDFGTGYSSLSYLSSFAVDKIKIDRSFVRTLGQGEGADLLVRTIIELGHHLGLTVVAEGVETPQQLAMIQGKGCDQVQGYLLGRPARMDPARMDQNEPRQRAAGREPELQITAAL